MFELQCFCGFKLQQDHGTLKLCSLMLQPHMVHISNQPGTGQNTSKSQTPSLEQQAQNTWSISCNSSAQHNSDYTSAPCRLVVPSQLLCILSCLLHSGNADVISLTVMSSLSGSCLRHDDHEFALCNGCCKATSTNQHVPSYM